MTTQLDLEQKVRSLYKATTSPQIVDVPRLTFLMIDGAGAPEGSGRYQDALQALFSLSYSLKFAIKRSGGPEHKVSPLEGLWWTPDMNAFEAGEKWRWKWTMMIRQPASVTAEMLTSTSAELTTKKHLPAVKCVWLESFAEGLAAQVLHLGPYDAEGPTIARLHAFIRDQGGHFDGRIQKHHEIYLGDPRRSAPERLRTIIRQPITAAADSMPLTRTDTHTPARHAGTTTEGAPE